MEADAASAFIRPPPPKRTVIGVCWLPHRAHHRHRTQISATSDVTYDTVFQDRNVKLSQKVYYLVNYYKCVLNLYNDTSTDDRVIVRGTSLLIFVNLHSENANFKGKIKADAPPYPPPPQADATSAPINRHKLYVAPKVKHLNPHPI